VKKSDEIRARLVEARVPFAANDCIAAHLEPGDLDALEWEVAAHVSALLYSLVIDQDEDHNTIGTAKRVAKMLVREAMRGRYELPPRVTDFPNVRELDEVYTVGPITVRSMCSHHLVPIVGKAWVGVIPDAKGKVIGLSKFTRLADWVMARPQIQEEATVQLADLLQQLVHPRGLALVVRAEHMCMTWRGVRDQGTEMVTSVMRGIFRDKPEARAEVLAHINGGTR
jgi:GTP cyclohydrolase I